MLDTLDGAPVPRAPATPRSIRAPSNSLNGVPVVFPEGYEFIEWLEKTLALRAPGVG